MVDLIQNGGKALVATKVFWGTAIGALPWLIPAVSAVAGTPGIPHAISVALGAFGSALAIIGRISATKTVTSILPR